MNLHDTNITCSFCGKNRTEVKAIVCGPAVYICNECVSFCKEVIDEKFSLVDGFGDGI